MGQTQALTVDEGATSQTLPIFKPVVVDDTDSSDTPDISTNGALSAVSGTLRMSNEEIDFPVDDTISVYEIKKGDTIATVAKLFGVSKNTIMWANDLKSEKLVPGETLIILPVTGVRHTVKKGDTMSSIAKKYKGDLDDIAKYNGIASDASLAIGDIIIVPDGEIATAPAIVVKSKVGSGNSTPSGFLVRPMVGGRKTQGIHGHNGIDIAASVGTPVLASASGVVISAKASGYNGGYGSMVIISHAGKIQTVYGHLSSVNVSTGQTVSQGQVIGAVGNTGKSTGPHLHFEVRGAKNPF